MKAIGSYITEKLHLNKDININNVNNPFIDINANDTSDLIDIIVEKCDNSGLGHTYVWNDTGKYDAYDDFENFESSDGTFIDWFDSFAEKVNKQIVAIWDISDKDKKDAADKNEFVKFFKESYEVEHLYKQDKYYVDYWGPYKYKKHMNVSLIECTTNKDGSPIICFFLNKKIIV